MFFGSNFVLLEFGWNSGLQGKGGGERRGWFAADSARVSFIVMAE